MHIILTHEQADFDALAALLAAHILNERAVPVLPRRMNRNVRAFLNLYGEELPFIEAPDLPQESIESVTLVDTQSLITLKGMGPKTKIHVIDHHTLKDDLPEDWTIIHERLGSCTAILTEDIRDHNGPLNILQATLLLLGIYEDTGALTYANTTPRDARAVAYLLEQGASLRIATEFLNPPLSENQRIIYDRLLHTTESMEVHGQNIIIASCNACELNEEISSIAHKLRDLLDPDALFLLVETAEGIRIVARSTTDRVNVAEVAAQFGGGGHERAAAALVRYIESGANEINPSLNDVYSRLIQKLPELVKPAITVGKIMSHGLRTLKPDTSAKDAAQMMQRYGHEGYPVIDGNHVVGLLTRRAVDRAIAHRLNLPASSLMEAGEVSVTPDDPLEHLQQIMTDTGWGQIPVVSPQNGEIIGIVTRTDLLQTLGKGQSLLPEHKNYASRLEAILPPARSGLLQIITEQATELHMPVYIVGGFVRDLILERPGIDFDIVVEGDAIALAHCLKNNYGGKVTSHNRFGAAKWNISAIKTRLVKQINSSNPPNPQDLPETLDLISARTEVYDHPTALPTVERSGIKLDLHRRDFTINTLALRLDGRHYGNLYDYWGGYNDIQKKFVRVLHSLSFVDDPTRMLRAVRFEQRFSFAIEARTMQLMNEAHDLLKQVSGDRIRHELDLIFSEDNPTKVLHRLDELNLLRAIHPSLVWNNEYSSSLEEALSGKIIFDWDLPSEIGAIPVRRALAYLVWFIPLGKQVCDALSKRLRLSHPLTTALRAAIAVLPQLESMATSSPSHIVELLDEIPQIALAALSLVNPSESVNEILSKYRRIWQKIHPETDGNTLRSLGIRPGPSYRQILWSLRSAWLDGKIVSYEQEKTWLHELINALQEP